MDHRSFAALTSATIILLLLQLQLMAPLPAGTEACGRMAELRRLGVVYAAVGPQFAGVR